MDLNLVIQKIAVMALPMLFAITMHEAAHGWVAGRLGDQTARMLGRVSANPLKHIDPFGTVILPLLMFLFTPVIFGWAKPVPVNARNFRNPRRDMRLVALAGPVSNLLMAFAWALIVKLGVYLESISNWLSEPLILMGAVGVVFNAALMALNMLPILPLDGGRVLDSLLPPKQSAAFSRLEPYGVIVVIMLLATGLLGYVLWPIIGVVVAILPASDNVWTGIYTLFS